MPLAGLVGLVTAAFALAGGPEAKPSRLAQQYATQVRPLLVRYCLKCHSTRKRKGDLDLEQFASFANIGRDMRPWQEALERLGSGEMPPKKSDQPSVRERQQLLGWVHGLLDAEARSHAGDPGRVVLRRLNNAEYSNTVRDLTGVDLKPAQDFPTDGAAGEGFSNTGDALVLSPTLVTRYLKAAKNIAGHAVLLPDGFRFSRFSTRRDWTDEVLAEMHQFYNQYSPDGRLPLRPYLLASIQHRDQAPDAVAAREKLNPKYLRVLMQTLADGTPSFPLDACRARWQHAQPKDVDALVAEIAAWQDRLWHFEAIGSYRYGHTIRQVPSNPACVPMQTLRFRLKPEPGVQDVMLYLSSRAAGPSGSVVWQRPRLEQASKPPLRLRDYPRFGRQFEIDSHAIFARTADYLAAAVEAANHRDLSPDVQAHDRRLNAPLLKRWIDLLAVPPRGQREAGLWQPLRHVLATPVHLLDARLPNNPTAPPVHGWVARGSDLPVVISNAAAETFHVPGRVDPHGIAVHPTPTEYVAVAWKSPISGRVRLGATITHAHPACGNGVVWWLEHRHSGQADVLAEGALNVGQGTRLAARELQVRKGDLVLLAVDPRNGDHACDLTEVALKLTDVGKPDRSWDLSHDVADSIMQANPHADRLGHPDTWQFLRGPARKPGEAPPAGPDIPADSVLGRWRNAASDPSAMSRMDGLGQQVRLLLTGPRPPQARAADRLLYDAMVSFDGPLLRGLDLSSFVPPQTNTRYSLPASRYSGDDLVVATDTVIPLRLPAGLFRDHEFVVEGRLAPGSHARATQFSITTTPPLPAAPLDLSAPVVVADPSAEKALRRGLDDFRRVFPSFICYARIVPDDETICLKLFHREDEPLERLFLSPAAKQRIDRLWTELRFISQWPIVEHKQLPQFIGFVSQDQPKELLHYFEGQQGVFRQRAEAFTRELEAAEPRQLQALLEFAGRAYRRPLDDRERAGLLDLYHRLRKRGLDHEEAFRTTLVRILIAPSFLFRMESTPPGTQARPVSEWELATRLSYFLWATTPDDELRRLAAHGRLHDAKVLSAQVARMLKDPRVRGLAVEFGTAWLHVRDLKGNHEKSEKLFPTFDDHLRDALFEETVRFLQDLFQNDGRLNEVLDTDHTFVNDVLARHYGIPGVSGAAWRRVDGVRKFGRGGILTLGSVLTEQSGASRTSPVLRGNWVLETLLGEKLPKPPPNVPQLPPEATASTGTVRQMVMRHTRLPECAGCHQRIDPIGFALENYDPIGRFRTSDRSRRPIDARVTLRDGTRFTGVDGLRSYLEKQRGNDVRRHFCRMLLGYALGRSVTLSDGPLLDKVLAALKNNDDRLSAAVQTIVHSEQFRYHRGLEMTKEEVGR